MCQRDDKDGEKNGKRNIYDKDIIALHLVRSKCSSTVLLGPESLSLEGLHRLSPSHPGSGTRAHQPSALD
jgi:hypothetical protein